MLTVYIVFINVKTLYVMRQLCIPEFNILEILHFKNVKSDATAVVEALLDEIKLANFGVFALRQKAERHG